MKRTNSVIIILFALFVFDIVYGAVTVGTSYGCNIVPPPFGQNQSLTDPCFYIYYYGIVGGSVLVIMILPSLEQPNQSIKLRKTC